MSVAKLSASSLREEEFHVKETQKSSSRDAAISQVACRALKELAIGLAGVALCSQFVFGGSSLIMLMVAVSITSVIVNAFIHWFSLTKVKNDEPVLPLFSVLRSLFFYTASISNLTILIHEAGHLFCAKKLFLGKHSIKLIPFLGGLTQFWTGRFTSLGLKIGYQYSLFLITLSGPLLAILAATVALTVGLLLRHSHFQTSSDMIIAGLMVFLEHAQYALSALWASEKDLGHDFVSLKAFGIHPLVGCAVILAIPTIICLGFLIKEHLNHLRSEKLSVFEPNPSMMVV
jgi:hypothetical protein